MYVYRLMQLTEHYRLQIEHTSERHCKSKSYYNDQNACDLKCMLYVFRYRGRVDKVTGTSVAVTYVDYGNVS